MKVAVVHYWLYGMRGGEKVLQEILKMYPQADLYTHLYIPEHLASEIKDRKVVTTFINRLPMAKKLYQAYLPLMPRALKQLNLRDYDLIISSESGPAKGVAKGVEACHICYCHSPMRYLWDQRDIYLENMSFLKGSYLRAITPFMRRWDVSSAQKVDHFVANSQFVGQRIKKIYGKPSRVVYPPVDVEFFNQEDHKEDYFVLAGQLVPYKRPDLAIKVFNKLKLKLKVIGTGAMVKELQKVAGPHVEFLGFLTDKEYKECLAKARALIFPGEEDFGIIPVEAQASGTPVIALGRGGALETVKGFYEGEKLKSPFHYTGVFFKDPTEESLQEAIKVFLDRETEFSPSSCRTQGEKFSREQFQRSFRGLVKSALSSSGFEA